MQLISLVLGWLSLVTTVETSLAFSAASFPVTSKKTSALNVASVEIPPVSEMERGVGGRIEDAFAAAKEKGEAAFVTFVTAGYPRAQGEFSEITIHNIQTLSPCLVFSLKNSALILDLY